jgi:stage II sporulation SpoM-like protein
MPMVRSMSASDVAAPGDRRHTRATLARWNADPGPVIGGWALRALAIAAALLVATWAIGELSTPDPRGFVIPGYDTAPTLGAVGAILARNGLVLALHGFACVAGFIAGSSLPREAERHTGARRWIHETAGPLAITFVGAATAFSLATQAYVLGGAASTLGAQLHLSPGVLLLCLTPHAVPELVALFLPLAAWLAASRRGRWDELGAATVVTVAIAVPLLALAALIEVYVSPALIAAVVG